MRFLSILALAAPLAAAIEFTSPSANSTVTKGSDYSLSWTTVETDPTEFNIYLVNFVTWPPSYVPLTTSGIETAKGSATVHIPCDTDSSYGYQFNAINGTNLYVIYAQSPKFSVGGAHCVDGHETEPETEEPTCAKETTTVYVTVSSSPLSTGPVHPTPHHPESTPSPACSYGTVPDTIGWSADYSHPVTLSSVPTPDAPVPTAAPEHHEAKKPVTVVVYHTVVVAGESCPCKAH